ncbi:MAG: hypothetical protein AAF850_05615 [Pseudomonadota bacterium]
MKTARARVAWVSADGAVIEPEIEKRFKDAHYAFGTTRDHDVLVIDARKRSLSSEDGTSISALLQKLDSARPVAVLINQKPQNQAQARLSSVARTFPTPENPEIAGAIALDACRRLLRRSALNSEVGERVKTLAAFNALEMAPEHPLRDPLRVLLAGAPSPTALRAMAALRSAGLEVEAAFTAAEALRAHDFDLVDALVVLPYGPSDPLCGFASSRIERLLPTAPPAMLIANAPHVNTCPASLIESDLATRVEIMAREAQQERMLISFLEKHSIKNVRDDLSEVAETRFFTRHAQRLFKSAKENDRAVALIGVSLNADEFRAASANARIAPLRRAAQSIKSASRAYDLVGHIGASTFMVTAPGAQPDDANAIADRYAGVLAAAPFEIGEGCETGSKPFMIEPATAAISSVGDGPLEEAAADVLSQLRARTGTPVQAASAAIS